MKNLHYLSSSLKFLSLAMGLMVAFIGFATNTYARTVDYDYPYAVGDDNSIYLLTKKPNHNGRNALRIVRVSPYNQVEKIYDSDEVRDYNSENETSLGKLMRTPLDHDDVDDMWWADGNLYVQSGDTLYRVPEDKSTTLEKVASDDWLWRQAELDKHREARFAIWRDADDADSILVDRVATKNDWPSQQLVKHDTYTRKALADEKQQWEAERHRDQQEKKDREAWLRRWEKLEKDRINEMRKWREDVRRSISRVRASIEGSTVNSQSQSAVTEGDAFSDQQQQQESSVKYEVRVN